MVSAIKEKCFSPRPLNPCPLAAEIVSQSLVSRGIWIVMMAIFVPVTILGFIGAQDREHSLTLNLFWAWWWRGIYFYLSL